jgi:hypothetical protein
MTRARILRTLGLLALGLVIAFPLFAQAERQVVYDETTHIVQPGYWPCIGALTLDFTVREWVEVLSDGAGGFHYYHHANAKQLRGVDSEGNVYSGNQVYREVAHVTAAAEYPLERTGFWNVELLGHGTAPNVLIKIRSRMTINAVGQVTVQRDIFDVTCR